MRAPTPASLVAWPLRICRPWVVATCVGLTLGGWLLRVDEANEAGALPSSYPEYAPRAAMQELSISGEVGLGLSERSFDLPASVSAASANLFAPAAPIAAEAASADAGFYPAE